MPRADWVAMAAIPAFQALVERNVVVESFASIGTGAGIDALVAAEVLNPDILAVTDIHISVVETAKATIMRNLTNPDIKVVMPDPVGSIYERYYRTGIVESSLAHPYQVEGIGEDHIAGCMDFDVVDEVMPFTDEQAFQTARKLARCEGILGGGSAGANIWCCLQIAGRLKRSSRIVTMIPDSGLKYLTKFYDDAWMRSAEYTRDRHVSA